MTTIAYRDGVLASDSLATLDNSTRLPGKSKKLWQLADGTIAGGAGNGFETAKVLNAATSVADIKIEGYSEVILSVTPDGIIRLHRGGSTIEFGGAPFFAIGSGAAGALAVMHNGASAEEAIRAAAGTDVFTGGDIQVLRVSPRAAIKAPPTNKTSRLRRLLSALFGGER